MTKLYIVEWTEEPEMDFLVHLTEDQADALRLKFEGAGIPHRIELPGTCDVDDINEILDDWIEDYKQPHGD